MPRIATERKQVIGGVWPLCQLSESILTGEGPDEVHCLGHVAGLEAVRPVPGCFRCGLMRSGNDVMGAIEDVCEESIQATKFFHGGPSRSEFGQVFVLRRGNPLTKSERNEG